LQAIDQKPPDWTADKKTHAQSEQQAARGNKVTISELLGLVDNAIELRNQAPVPSAAAARFSTARSGSWVLPAANFPESALLA
jgi:hypothetical protein